MSNFSFYAPLDKGPTCYQHPNANGLYLGRTTATQYLLSSNIRDDPVTTDSRSSLISNESSSSSAVSSCGSIRIEAVISSSSPTSKKALIGNQVQLRFLNPGDYETVKKLCEDWFPVE